MLRSNLIIDKYQQVGAANTWLSTTEILKSDLSTAKAMTAIAHVNFGVSSWRKSLLSSETISELVGIRSLETGGKQFQQPKRQTHKQNCLEYPLVI